MLRLFVVHVLGRRNTGLIVTTFLESVSLVHITYLRYREHAFELGEVRIGILTDLVITVVVRLSLFAELSLKSFTGGGLHDQTKIVTLDSGRDPIL